MGSRSTQMKPRCVKLACNTTLCALPLAARAAPRTRGGSNDDAASIPSPISVEHAVQCVKQGREANVTLQQERIVDQVQVNALTKRGIDSSGLDAIGAEFRVSGLVPDMGCIANNARVIRKRRDQ